MSHTKKGTGVKDPSPVDLLEHRGEEPNPTWVLPPQDAHLMPQANQLELQGGAATKSEGEDGNDGGQNRGHACDGMAVAPKSLDFLSNSEF
jgi:hypothetical protein